MRDSSDTLIKLPQNYDGLFTKCNHDNHSESAPRYGYFHLPLTEDAFKKKITIIRRFFNESSMSIRQTKL